MTYEQIAMESLRPIDINQPATRSVTMAHQALRAPRSLVDRTAPIKRVPRKIARNALVPLSDSPWTSGRACCA